MEPNGQHLAKLQRRAKRELERAPNRHKSLREKAAYRGKYKC
jgi:hypothetical protein